MRKVWIVMSSAVLCMIFSTASAAFDRILLICNEELWDTSVEESLLCQDGILTYAGDLDEQGYEIVYNTSHAGTITNFTATGGRTTGNVLLVDEWGKVGGYLIRPDELRQYIKERYNESGSIKGAVLIGDVAEPRWEYWVKHLENGEWNGEWDWEWDPLDIAFMDMDGTWEDTDDNYYLDSHETDEENYKTPEIWMGRITPSSLVRNDADDDSRPYWYGGSGFATQAKMIHTYFERVHNYRAGNVELQRSGGALVYNDDDTFMLGKVHGVDCLYPNDYVLVGRKDHPEEDKDTNPKDFQERLVTDDYEWVHVHVHGSPHSIGFYRDRDRVDPPSDWQWENGGFGSYHAPGEDNNYAWANHWKGTASYKDHAICTGGPNYDGPPKPLFYFADNCETSRYTAPNCLGSAYILHPTETETYGLLVIGHAAVSGSNVEESPFYDALFKCRPIGEAFKESNSTDAEPGLRIFAHGMTLLGDPTLRVGVGSEPDLAIRSIDIKFSSPTPDMPNAGDNVAIRAIITNRGRSSAGGFCTRFWHGDPDESGHVVIGTVSLDSIAALGVDSVEVTWGTLPDMYGEQQIFVRVDVENQVAESDEGNNEASRPIRLYLYEDEFPKPVEGGYSQKMTPVLVDCDDDGAMEIIIGKRCFKSNGALEWTLADVDECGFAPAVGDLDGDGTLEVVFCHMNGNYDNGEIRVFDAATGVPKPQWDTYSPSGTPHIRTSPTLADLDHDGKLGVVFGADDEYFGHTRTTSNLYVISWNSGIGEWDDWDKEITPVETLSFCPAVGDVDGDGDLEIVVCTREGNVHCYEKVGSELVDAWDPPGPTDVGHTIVGPPVLADVDADGGLEVVLFGYTGDTPIMTVLDAQNGDLKWNVVFESTVLNTNRESVLSVGNLDADEFKEIVVNVTCVFGNEQNEQYEPKIYVVHPNGTNGAPSLVKAFDTELSRGCVIGDVVGGDGQMELVTVAGDWGYVIDPINPEPAGVDSFPISRSADMYSFPALGNLDGDAYPEIVFGAGRELHVVDYHPGTLGNVEWPMYQHDPRHTGLLCSKSGPLTGHEIWCGTVYVTGDVTVLFDATLTIQPGTEVLFAANSDDKSGGYSSSRCELIVQGKLVAEGTESNPITFRSTNTSNPTKSDWYGIRFDSSADPASVVEHCTIRDAWGGIYLRPSSDSPDITYNTITNCTRGVYGYSSQQITIEHNTLDYNTYGLYLNYAGTGNIQCNSASHNSSRGMVLYYCNPSNVSGNTVSYNGAYGGIRMNGSSCTPFMASNIVKHNGDGGIYGYGIYLCYGADATLASNKIGYNSSHGVKLYNASPTMDYYGCAHNATEHNGNCELYLIDSSPCLDYGRNDFVPDTGLGTYYHIYIQSGNAVAARGNWWGTNDPAAFSFYPAGSVDYSDSSSSPNTEGVGKIIASPGLAAHPGKDAYDLLFKAIDFKKEGQYSEAAKAYEEVIEKYPDSPAARPAMSGLLSAHRGMGKDLLALRACYGELSSSRAGTGLGRKARWLSIDCLELSGDCKGAIAEYQALRSGGGEEGVAAALRMGEVYLYGLRDREAAGKVFEQILSDAPESEAALLASEHLAELRELSQLEPEPRSEPGVAKVSQPCPEEITLSSNWPNPFNPRTVITFALPEPAFVKLEVYNILGQRVSIPVEGLRQAGTHSVNWNGKDASGMEMASGVYFYRLVVDKGEFVQAKKMLLMR